MAIEPTTSADPVALAVDVVGAYVARNRTPPSELTRMLQTVHAALAGLAHPVAPVAAPEPEPEVVKPAPAAIRKSVTPDGLVSFVDGRAYKTLRRHLTAHGLSERTYRARYGLPADYPMTAPNYAKQRSDLAKAIGLGRPGGVAARKA